MDNSFGKLEESEDRRFDKYCDFTSKQVDRFCDIFRICATEVTREISNAVKALNQPSPAAGFQNPAYPYYAYHNIPAAPNAPMHPMAPNLPMQPNMPIIPQQP